MSVGNTTRRSGGFGVLGSTGETQSRSLVDEQDLDDGVKEALEADDFIIYGKASVEKYDNDNPPQKILMEAFEEKIPAFLDGGIISRRHKDIPVGEPVESYTLDEPAEIEVGNQTHSFDAGEELRTEVRDGEVWIVANLRNDSELALETREGCMKGELDGFSVTVFCKEWDETTKGQEVSEIDWHSTTIGQDHLIKNPDSKFGVAEFKADFSEALGVTERKAEEAALKIFDELPTTMSEPDEKSFWERVRGVADQKADEAEENSEVDEKEGSDPPDQMPPGVDDEDEDGEDEDEKSDFDAVLEKVESELGEEDAETIKEMVGGGGGDGGGEDGHGELKSEVEELKSELAEAKEVVQSLSEKAVMQEDLSEKAATKEELEEVKSALPDEGELATKEELQSVSDTAEKAVKEVVPSAVEEASEKMATGGTPSPSGGSTNDQSDYKAEIEERFGSQ